MKRVLCAIVFVIAGVGIAFGSVTPTLAWGACPEGLLCAWDKTDASGTRWTISYTQYKNYVRAHNNYPCFNLSSTTGDRKWELVRNLYGSDLVVKVWTDQNCHGLKDYGLVIPNHGSYVNLAVNFTGAGEDYKDSVRSFTLYSMSH